MDKMIFDTSIILEASMLTHISPKKLTAVVNVQTINKVEHQRLLAFNREIIEIPLGDSDDIFLYVKGSDTVYYYSPASSDKKPLMLFLIAYNVLYTKSTNISSLTEKLAAFYSNQYEISQCLLHIEHYERKINELSARYFGGFIFKTAEDLLNVCKRMKVKCKQVDDLFELTFKKVRIGNETEGWINYKSVTVRIDLFLHIKSTRYEFNSFVVDTAWHIPSMPVLHPHINASSNFCFGSRKVDWQTYKKTLSYPFAIDLIRETVYSYNAEAPYVHVNQIASTVNVLENILKITEVLDEDGNLITYAKNPGLFSQLFLRKATEHTCPHCGTYTLTDAKGNMTSCANINCVANPHAVLNCRGCGHVLSRDDWDIGNSRYQYNCHNPSCRFYVPSPEELAVLAAKLAGEGLPCQSCGEPIKNTAEHTNGTYLYCLNKQCNSYGLWQYNRNGTKANTQLPRTFQHNAFLYALTKLNSDFRDELIAMAKIEIPDLSVNEESRFIYKSDGGVKFLANGHSTSRFVFNHLTLYKLAKKYLPDLVMPLNSMKDFLINLGETVDES